MSKEVINRIGDLVYKKLDEVKEFQGELKELTKQSYEFLKTSLLRHGNIGTLYIWKNNILDGHQRLKTLLQLQKEGITVPSEIPCVEIKADNKKQAKRFLLQYVSQQGKVTPEGLYEYIHDSELQDELDLMSQELDIPGLDFEEFQKGWFEEPCVLLPDGEKTEFEQITFTLHNEQAEQVKQAIEIAKGKGPFVDSTNENSNGNALARIVETYITQNG